MKISLAQINSIVGDLEGNTKKIKAYIKKAKKNSVDVVAFPELAISGYPPQDLVLNYEFVEENKKKLQEIVGETEGITAIVGFINQINENNKFNAAAIVKDKKIVNLVYKTLLPTYDVFDEDRYFKPNKKSEIKPIPIEIKGEIINFGIEICEDLWDESYDIKVTDLLADLGADIIINISASPFYAGKYFLRESIIKDKSKKNKIPMFYVNLVGGQDELVFDGHSFAVDGAGKLIALAKQFQEDLITVDIDLHENTIQEINKIPYSREEEIFNALVLGIHDYFKKTGFIKAIIGMSGGIDSSLTTCLAVEALGKENVIGCSMPSKYSTDHSKKDAELLAEKLGIKFIQIPIQAIVDSYKKVMKEPLDDIRHYFKLEESKDDLVADENIQPRVRGNLLMDVSNRLKDSKILVLNTGNKTEMALGYCTLYGDMTGGLGAIGDVSKTEVYALAKYYNEKKGTEIIPTNVLIKKPSAELKMGQFDPFDYDIVSPLVDEIIENRKSRKELIKMGFKKEVVEDTIKRIKRSEYKRWQAPPCIKITPKAFGLGWKMPIVNKFKLSQ